MSAERSPGADILIVEDQVDLRETLAELLEIKGYRVSTAPNGQEALAWLRRATLPHFILLDLQMPVMNGWAFRRKQQELPALAQIPVVVISGEPSIAEEAATMKVAGHLAKPVNLDALFVLLDRLSV